jgi:hypothetical protein
MSLLARAGVVADALMRWRARAFDVLRSTPIRARRLALRSRSGPHHSARLLT